MNFIEKHGAVISVICAIVACYVFCTALFNFEGRLQEQTAENQELHAANETPFFAPPSRAAPFSRSPEHHSGGYSIAWSESQARPIDVLRACESRMEHVQASGLGSDANARALFAVAEAIDHLSGSNEVTAKPISP